MHLRKKFVIAAILISIGLLVVFIYRNPDAQTPMPVPTPMPVSTLPSSGPEPIPQSSNSLFERDTIIDPIKDAYRAEGMDCTETRINGVRMLSCKNPPKPSGGWFSWLGM